MWMVPCSATLRTYSIYLWQSSRFSSLTYVSQSSAVRIVCTIQRRFAVLWISKWNRISDGKLAKKWLNWCVGWRRRYLARPYWSLCGAGGRTIEQQEQINKTTPSNISFRLIWRLILFIYTLTGVRMPAGIQHCVAQLQVHGILTLELRWEGEKIHLKPKTGEKRKTTRQFIFLSH